MRMVSAVGLDMSEIRTIWTESIPKQNGQGNNLFPQQYSQRQNRAQEIRILTLSSEYDIVTVLRAGKAVWDEHDIFRHVTGWEKRRLDGDREGKPAGRKMC